MRSIMASRDATEAAGSWPVREALAVDLREERTASFSFSTCFWTVLKFRREISWGRRRRG